MKGRRGLEHLAQIAASVCGTVTNMVLPDSDVGRDIKQIVIAVAWGVSDACRNITQCQCQIEVGDSPCPRHPSEDDLAPGA